MKVGPFANGAAPPLNDETANRMDQGIYDAHQDIAGLVNLGMEFFRVRNGIPRTGVGNPTADQAGFAAARAVAIAAPYGGIVYVAPALTRLRVTLIFP